MSFARTSASVVVSSLALFGCTALLGTFEVGGSSSGPAEAGGSSDAANLGDSEGGDANGVTLPLLKCSISGGTPTLVDTAQPPPVGGGGGGGGQLRFDRPAIFHIADGQVRIVSRPSQSPGFTVYDLHTNSGQPPAKLEVTTGSGFQAAHRTANAISVLAFSNAAGTSPPQTQLVIHRIQDNGLMNVPIPLTAPGAVSNMGGGSNSNGPSADFLEVGVGGATDYFYTYTPSAASAPFQLLVGRGNSGMPIGPRLLYLSNDAADPAHPISLLHAGPRVFMPLDIKGMNGPPSTSNSMIDTTDDGAVPTLAMARSLAPPSRKVNMFFGGGPSKRTPTAANVAFVELDLMSATTPITFRIGQVDNAKLSTFTAADVPVVFSFDSATRLPTDGGNSAWYDDQFLAIGKGTGVPGLNFIWYDAAAGGLRANQTGPDALLQNRAFDKDSQVAIALASVPLPIFTSFDLTWTETVTVDGSMTQALYYAELDCIH